jgi:serine/threonine protein kinase/tetratricopeptide (TPR) repeat protein
MMTTVFQRVGPYEILAEIGRGGMAAVFLATDSRTSRRVALKLVPTGNDREAREILEAERWGAKLQEQFCLASGHVPAVYEHGTEWGYFYIAMEYLEGLNLSEVIAAGPLSSERAAGIAVQLCEFLEAAHGFEVTIDGRPLRSLLHGDLKPRNIKVTQGDRVKVLDFGIAKALSLSRKVTRNDFGSIAYLSPERLESGEIDPQSDFWAVGVLLYEMVSGGLPFQAPDTRRLEQRIQSRQPPTSLGGRCTPGLAAMIGKLLAGRPEDRYAAAAAIREDLERVVAGRETQAEHEGWPNRASDEPPTRRTRPPESVEDEVTRRTREPIAAKETTAAQPSGLARQKRSLFAALGTFISRRPLLRTALLLLALASACNEIRVASVAGQLAASVPTRELDELAGVWDQYEALSRGSLRIGVVGLERALAEQTGMLSDRVIANYRTALPSVRETQWRLAREALAHAVSALPTARLKASLRYCDGHLHRIDGEARKARGKIAEAQQEFTDAVTAFREAAELRPNWPDPFLGLARTFIYGLEDVDRGADALTQAQRLGYTPGDRETTQLADGYRARGDTLARTARTLAGLAQEQEYLTRSAEAYRRALDLYANVVNFADVARTMRLTQRALGQIEQRIANLSRPAVEPPPQENPIPVPREGGPASADPLSLVSSGAASPKRAEPHRREGGR